MHELQASEVLAYAYQMRDQHEKAFLAGTLDEHNPDFDATRRSFGYAASRYDSEIPVLGTKAEV